jgi:hypothetical protein
MFHLSLSLTCSLFSVVFFFFVFFFFSHSFTLYYPSCSSVGTLTYTLYHLGDIQYTHTSPQPTSECKCVPVVVLAVARRITPMSLSYLNLHTQEIWFSDDKTLVSSRLFILNRWMRSSLCDPHAQLLQVGSHSHTVHTRTLLLLDTTQYSTQQQQQQQKCV